MHERNRRCEAYLQLDGFEDSIYRFLSETIRPDVRDASGLTDYQWASLAQGVGLAWLWWRDVRQRY